VISVAAAAQGVTVDYNHKLDFSRFHTYAWGEQQNANQIMSPSLAQETQNQVNSQLQARGLMLRQEREAPDLIVVTSGGMKPQTSYKLWRTGDLVSITPDTSSVGTLIVDLYDANNKRLAWRGVAQGALNQGNSNENRQLVEKTVTSMFQKYPLPATK